MTTAAPERRRALLLVAHGSRREGANDEVRVLTERLRGRAPGFWRVRCAFLELATPDIPGALAALAEEGSDEIVVLPYFLAAGRHVTDDIPGCIAEVAARYPRVRFRQAPWLGAAEDIVEVLARLVER